MSTLVLFWMLASSAFASSTDTPVTAFEFAIRVEKAFQVHDIKTIGEAALINDAEEAKQLLGRMPSTVRDKVQIALQDMGLDFGRSPFPELPFRDRLLLDRAGINNNAALVTYLADLRDRTDHGAYQERLNMFSPRLRVKISSLTEDPQIEAEDRLKNISDEMDALLRLIQTKGDLFIRLTDRNTEIVHKTAALLDPFKRILEQYRQQAECQRAVDDPPENE